MYNNSDVSVMGISQYYFPSKDHHWITKKPYDNQRGRGGGGRERERAFIQLHKMYAKFKDRVAFFPLKFSDKWYCSQFWKKKKILIPPFLDCFGHSIDSLLPTVNVTKETMPLVISTALSTIW